MILEQCFQTHIYLQNLASIQPRTSPLKFAASVQPPRLQAHRAPLHYAAVWGQQEMIEIFLLHADSNAEAVANMQDRFGSTPLALAVSNCLEVCA